MRAIRLLRMASMVAVAAAFCMLAGQNVSQASIVGSDHDFSSKGCSGGRICIVCHTPHNADTSVADAPLWNHEVTQATFTTYSSPTLDATVGPPSGVSKLCLSCHDGTVAIDSYGGNSGTKYIDGGKKPGTDLSNDHPISFTYGSALAASDGELVDPAADADGDPETVGDGTPYLPLFNGTLQCATCHDVHNTVSQGNPDLLIRPRSGSQICLTCHTK